MHSKRTLPLFLVCIALVLPGLSYAGVKISLKNGREVIADSCTEATGKLVCEKMGGFFEIEKKDVLDMEQVKIAERKASPEVPEPAGEQNRGDSEETGAGSGILEKKNSPDDSGRQNSDKTDVKLDGLSADAQKRVDQIIRKKEQLNAKRAKILREKEQLNEDIKAKGVLTSGEQLDETKKRIAELDEKVKAFNEEASQLEKDERKITEELKAGRK